MSPSGTGLSGPTSVRGAGGGGVDVDAAAVLHRLVRRQGDDRVGHRRAAVAARGLSVGCRAPFPAPACGSDTPDAPSPRDSRGWARRNRARSPRLPPPWFPPVGPEVEEASTRAAGRRRHLRRAPWDAVEYRGFLFFDDQRSLRAHDAFAVLLEIVGVDRGIGDGDDVVFCASLALVGS